MLPSHPVTPPCRKSRSQSPASQLRSQAQGEGGNQRSGYWCVICGRFLPSDDGVIVHDDVPHPADMTFDDEDKPQ